VRQRRTETVAYLLSQGANVIPVPYIPHATTGLQRLLAAPRQHVRKSRLQATIRKAVRSRSAAADAAAAVAAANTSKVHSNGLDDDTVSSLLSGNGNGDGSGSNYESVDNRVYGMFGAGYEGYRCQRQSNDFYGYGRYLFETPGNDDDSDDDKHDDDDDSAGNRTFQTPLSPIVDATNAQSNACLQLLIAAGAHRFFRQTDCETIGKKLHLGCGKCGGMRGPSSSSSSLSSSLPLPMPPLVDTPPPCCLFAAWTQGSVSSTKTFCFVCVCETESLSRIF
jgi:hypothetical protein